MESTARGPRFQLDRVLGKGATGEVLLAVLLEDFAGLEAGSEVAVKYLHTGRQPDPEAEAAFAREARAALAVRDPGLVRALATGRDERGPFLVMEYVPGKTLGEILAREGPIPEPALRSIAAQVSHGLSALHDQGYVHGDVKPENIRFDSSGRAVLVDLGFAQLAGAARESLQDAGTFLYLDPDRLRGGKATEQSDVFALGVVLFEVGTGVHPFVEHEDLVALEDPRRSSAVPTPRSPETTRVVERILRCQAPLPSAHNALLSPFFDRLVSEMLEPHSERRPRAVELFVRFDQGEVSAWWRSRLDVEVGRAELQGGREHLTPFVGRDELTDEVFEEALRALDEELAPRGTAVWLEGPLGSGKTRFSRELSRRIRTSSTPPRFVYGRCRALREHRPCQPLLRMLQRSLGLTRLAVPSDRERRQLENLVPPSEAATLLAALDPEASEATPVSVPAALAAWILALGSTQPVLFVLDDLHHADAETLRALSLAAAGLARSRILCVFCVGTDGDARHADGLQGLRRRLEQNLCFVTPELAPLELAHVEELVHRLFDHASPRLRIADVLQRRTRGHPGLVAESLRAMRRSGDLVPSRTEPDRYELAIPPEAMPLPETLQRAISESFRALPESDRLWLQRLSVVGGRIETDFLVRAFPPSNPSEVDAVLARLVRQDWLLPRRARYRFVRPSAREAVYRTMSKTRRRNLHADAARALKSRPGDPISVPDAFQRAFHLRASENPLELLQVLRPLARWLAVRGLPQRVRSLCGWGLEALDQVADTPERRRQRIELIELALDAADSIGARRDQRDLLDRLATALEGDLGPEDSGRVYLLNGRYSASIGDYGLARGWLNNAALAFREAGAEILESDALRRLAEVHASVGELDESERLCARALERAADDDLTTALALVAAGTVDVLRDRLEDALRASDRALKLLRPLPGPRVGAARASAQLLRARVYRSAGRPARALGAGHRALDRARRSGERRLEAEAGARLGGLLLDVDRPEDAEAHLREAWLLGTEIEDRRAQALAALFLGVLLGESDRAETSRWLDQACALAAEVGLHRLEALALAVSARLDWRENRPGRAAVAIARADYLLEHYGAELHDRVVIQGTASLLAGLAGEEERARSLEQSLRRRLRREVAKGASELLRRRRRVASTRLIEAVLSLEGPIYPRLRLVYAGS